MRIETIIYLSLLTISVLVGIFLLFYKKEKAKIQYTSTEDIPHKLSDIDKMLGNIKSKPEEPKPEVPEHQEQADEEKEKVVQTRNSSKKKSVAINKFDPKIAFINSAIIQRKKFK